MDCTRFEQQQIGTPSQHFIHLLVEAATVHASARAVFRRVLEEGVDAGRLRGLYDDDRIRLGGFNAPIELDAESAAEARSEQDVLLLAVDFDEAVGNRRSDAFRVIHRARAIEHRADRFLA